MLELQTFGNPEGVKKVKNLMKSCGVVYCSGSDVSDIAV